MTQPAIDAIYPLTPMQQGMLFHCLAEPEAGLYWNRFTLELTGAVQSGILENAWADVVARQPVLRTVFVWQNRETPVQVVLHDVTLPWEELDWSGIDEHTADARLEELLEASRAHRPDLTKAPLFRLTLVRLSPERHLLVWSLHHLLLDGWSLQLILRDVVDAYEARLAGRSLPRSSAPPFRDFVAWLHKQDPNDGEAVWRRSLAGVSSPTPLPAADVAIPKGAAGYAVDEIALSAANSTTLAAFAKQHRLTLNTLMQGAWAIVLARYSGERDVLFGATVAGRPPALAQSEAIVGLFINTIPARVAVEESASIVGWLQELQRNQTELRQFEHTSLTRVQQWSDIPRGQPLFDSVLVFESFPLDTSLDGGVRPMAVSIHASDGRTNLPLTAVVLPGDVLRLRLVTQRRRFAPAIARQLLGHWVRVLEQLAAPDDRTLRDIELVTAAESAPARTAPSADASTVLPVDGNGTLQELFDAQASRTPDAVALRCEGVSLTYSEVQTRVDAVARRLRELGAGPNVLVGLCMERSLDLVVGLFGILKAGAAYLPIDLAYPPERLAFMLADAQAPLLLTQSALIPQLPVTTSRVVSIDTIDFGADFEGDDRVQPNTTADDLAYVIYTSGTTGQPKGAEITHRNVVRLLSSTEHWFGFNERDVWTLFHSTAFDFSVWELFGALLYGGRLVVVPHVDARSPEQFHRLLRTEGVTVLNQTPSAFRQLIAADATAEPGALALRYVVFGGEALNLASLRPWFERHGDVRPQLVNMYGITETTVHVTYRALSMNDVDAGSVIGVPIPDLDVHILDAVRRPVPIGVSGEMFVGGAGLARGYLRRPDLTAARFVDDHVGGRPGARLYKTGDLARRLPNGDIEYLGRADDQVKIRGFRIELGEIESVLHAHPDVAEACVMVREDTADEKRLVAYLVGRRPINLPSVRTLLRTKLPEYMVPAAFVTMDALPLTASGKIDRRKLPAPDAQRPDLDVAFAVPATTLERQIAEVWQGVLRVSAVGLHDNFFDLGGNSLSLVQVYDRVRRLVPRREWSMVDMFRYPTLHGLAQFLAVTEQPAQPSLSSAQDRGRRQRAAFAGSRGPAVKR